MKNIKGTALAITDGWLNTVNAKTTHGLIRGSERFELIGVLDGKNAGKDAGEVLDGIKRGIPIYESLESYLNKGLPKPDYCLIGIATPGGVLPPELRAIAMTAIKNGISVVNGLHEYLDSFPDLKNAAEHHNVDLIDIRKPRLVKDLQFWSGEIYNVEVPRIAVLGIDCAVGKRTTSRFLWELCNNNGIKADMIYTGQTGWMQGFKHGFIFDSTLNDFISGEIERAILDSVANENPDVIFIEGQSALRNPSGPCGSEFLVSGGVKGVVLQHVPYRGNFKIKPITRPLPSVKSEVELIKMYGATTLAVTLNAEGKGDTSDYQKQLADELGIPVLNPLTDDMSSLLPVIKNYIDA